MINNDPPSDTKHYPVPDSIEDIRPMIQDAIEVHKRAEQALQLAQAAASGKVVSVSVLVDTLRMTDEALSITKFIVDQVWRGINRGLVNRGG